MPSAPTLGLGLLISIAFGCGATERRADPPSAVVDQGSSTLTEGTEAASISSTVIAPEPESRDDGPTAEDLAGWTWSLTAPRPFSVGSEPAAAWSGEELLVWGGQTSEAIVGYGLAYRPDADSWRELPPAPSGGRLWPVNAMTPAGWLFVGGFDGTVARADGFAFDPRTDEWFALPDAPFAPASPKAGAWTGTELVIIDGPTGRAAALTPGQDHWDPLPLIPAGTPASANVRWEVVWDGQRVTVWQVSRPADPTQPARTLGHRLVDDSRELVGPFEGVAPRNVMSTVDGLVGFDDICRPGGSCPPAPLSLVSFDGAVWSPRVTATHFVSMASSTAVIGGTVVMGGCCSTSGDGQSWPGSAFTLDTNTWLPLPPTPMATGETLVWTGRELIALGRDTDYLLTPYVRTPSPAADTHRTTTTPAVVTE